MKAEDLVALASLLNELGQITSKTGWKIGAYGPVDVSDGETFLRVAFDEGSKKYLIDDQVGS
jgi:hypothetical protein